MIFPSHSLYIHEMLGQHRNTQNIGVDYVKQTTFETDLKLSRNAAYILFSTYSAGC